jgi:D-glycero-D-manno-heptose 1,7-bisphosphate phosphatase
MLLTAARTWDIDLKRSFAIGDQWKDMEAGKAAGCTTVLIDYPYNQDVRADVRVPDLPSALQTIKEVEASFSHG